MVQQNVLPVQELEKVLVFDPEFQFPSGKGRVFQLRAVDAGVEVHQPGQIHGTFGAEDLPGVELEVGAKTFCQLITRRALDFETHGIAFTPVVQLAAHALEHRARLLFLHVQVAVARDAEGHRLQHLVPAIHTFGVSANEVGEKDDVTFALGRGKGDLARERSWHGDDAEHGNGGDSLCRAAFVTEKQGDAEGFVQHAREGMGRVDGDWREQGVDFGVVEVDRKGLLPVRQLRPGEDADSGVLQRGQQLLSPATVLCSHKLLHLHADAVEQLLRAHAALVALGGHAVFDPLQDAGDADFDKLIEVAARDGEELDALEKGVGVVLRFLEDASVEAHPAFVATEEAERRFRLRGPLGSSFGSASMLLAYGLLFRRGVDGVNREAVRQGCSFSCCRLLLGCLAMPRLGCFLLRHRCLLSHTAVNML